MAVLGRRGLKLVMVAVIAVPAQVIIIAGLDREQR